jgi:hypothetical protein
MEVSLVPIVCKLLKDTESKARLCQLLDCLVP